jgi:hypothetical protein
MVFPFRNPQTLTHKKEDYLAVDILTMTSILQGGFLNTTKKEGVLSESTRSSTGGRWLGGIVFLPCPSTDVQHLLL